MEVRCLRKALEQCQKDLRTNSPSCSGTGSSHWWDGYEDLAEIDYDGPNNIPILFSSPQIKVFTDENQDNCYLYYLNRYCRENGNPFEITVEAGDYPFGTPFSEYALDHSRRFLVEGEMAARDVYVFRDTLMREKVGCFRYSMTPRVLMRTSG